MLIDLIKMPPVFGLPIDRRITLHSERDVPLSPFDIHWPDLPLYKNPLRVGSAVNTSPNNLYKAVHLGMSSNTVFETVFAVEGNPNSPQNHICLYTKIVSTEYTQVGISLKAIGGYRSNRAKLIPISQFLAYCNQVSEVQSNIVPFFNRNPVDEIVPPVFGEKLLWSHINHLLNIEKGPITKERLGWCYRPLFDQVPSVLNALIDGYFTQSPLSEIKVHYPFIEIIHDKWSSHDEFKHMTHIRGFEAYFNHPEFDRIALALLQEIRPVKLNVSCLMTHALDGILDLRLTREYNDPYQKLFYTELAHEHLYQERLSEIFFKCATIYCKMCGIDSNIFLSNSYDKSSVTLSKNIYDEITVTFHDLIHSRYISFYTSFPAIALATLSVGEAISV